MSDRFHPITMEQLTNWVFTELAEKDALFGIPRAGFFTPRETDRFRIEKYGTTLETPFGVAAGPHTQMAQNIIVSWLVGARFLELKTVQTLDELDVNKPCIDLEDEGYNVEWSQELKVYESFDEYLRAWVLIHALHHMFGFPGDRPGMIFNMSVGYNLEGILKPNVQWFFEKMADASEYLPRYVEIVAEHYPAVRDLDIPTCLSDTITLSTMHGCPPDEIERITTYLMEERGLHSSVKCNPTLLGAEGVRSIVNEELEFSDIPIPDEAFGHDLMYVDAVPMFNNLRRVAENEQVTFGLKLTNTLEVNNWRDVFEEDDMMYLSGRALHPVTTSLAHKISEEFHGDLLLSFAGGADCFNVVDLLASGMKTITVCSDLLKSGGYLRMLQYIENTNAAMDELGAVDVEDLIARRAVGAKTFGDFAGLLADAAAGSDVLDIDVGLASQLATRLTDGSGPPLVELAAWASEHGFDDRQAEVLRELTRDTLARINLGAYADLARRDWRLQKHSLRTDRSKTTRELHLFDCIEAPCVDECPVDQRVPEYMAAVRERDFARAVKITRADNPLPAVLGQVCDHLCENTCVRTHFDQPLAIRQMKKFIMSHETKPELEPQSAATGHRVAIIGAGPAGLSAAQELAYAGFGVTVFEAHPYPGGMVGGAIPEYRLPQTEIDQDMAVLHDLGVEFRYGQKAGVDFTLDELRSEGFGSIFVAVGAQLAKRLGLDGEDSDGIMDALVFLRNAREGHPVPIGARVGVIGAGDTAMDAVRSSVRLGAEHASLIYRRTKDQMPADPEEVHACGEEGIEIFELSKPHALHIEDGKLVGLVCTRNEYRGDRDSSGRKIPYEIPNSEFEIPLDTLILAISQHSIVDFFGDRPPELTSKGYIEINDRFETTIPGVYAGGDVADDGPSSIVKAAADGKAVAAVIISANNGAVSTDEPNWQPVDLPSLILRRGRRDYRVPIRHTDVDDRLNFKATVLNYTEEEAVAEASRCIDCHEICSLCVGVCPNMALMTYQIEPFRAELPVMAAAGGAVEVGGSYARQADQRLQIVVLTDFCNECGNCVTACPTSGTPYIDKPRLYLNRADFLAEKTNAFMMFRDADSATLEARWDGETHRMTLGGSVEYSSPSFDATLDAESFQLVEARPTDGVPNGQALSLDAAADMYVVLTGLLGSMPQIPSAIREGDAGSHTVIPHPGYSED